VTKLKVGIAGYGVVGKRRKACVDRNPHMRVVAVCDRNFSDSGVMEGGVRYFPDYKSLLQQDLDVLIVCLTNEIAPEVTIAGLEKGLHVFC
jgi:predicted dehydrogenase